MGPPVQAGLVPYAGVAFAKSTPGAIPERAVTMRTGGSAVLLVALDNAVELARLLAPAAALCAVGAMSRAPTARTVEPRSLAVRMAASFHW